MMRRMENLVSGSVRDAQRVAEAAAEPLLGAAERGVKTGYAILEDVMARGRDAARRFEPPSSSTAGSTGERWPWWNMGPMAPVMTPMMGPWINLMKMWGDSVAAFVPGGAPAIGQVMDNVAGMARGTSRFKVTVLAQGGATVAASLEAVAPGVTLGTTPLNPAPGTAGPAISDWTASATPDGIALTITVPDGQPKGTYVGTVTDTGGVRRGEVTLEFVPGKA